MFGRLINLITMGAWIDVIFIFNRSTIEIASVCLLLFESAYTLRCNFKLFGSTICYAEQNKHLPQIVRKKLVVQMKFLTRGVHSLHCESCLSDKQQSVIQRREASIILLFD